MSEGNQQVKEDFLKHVEEVKDEASFDDEEGIDILCSVCAEHKALPISLRNWNELAGALGLGVDGEYLRCWYKAHLRQDGTLPRNPRIALPSDQSKSPDSGTQRTIADMEEEKQSLYVERQQTRDVWNAYRRTMRETARVEELKQLISEAAGKAPRLPDYKYDGPTREGGSEAILMISDLHIGDHIKNEYNIYDASIAAKRMACIVEKTVERCRRDNVEILDVVNLGDLIEGILHTSARLEQEMPVTEQIMIASDLLAQSLNGLLKAAPKVIYRSCVDNHSRAMADYHQNIESENFSKIIDFYIKAKLDGKGIVFANDNFDDDIGRFSLQNGKKVIFVHGHRDHPGNIFSNMVGMTHEYVDYCLMGHYHSPAYREDNGCAIITNGSVCGTNKYAMSKRYFGHASQNLLVFSGEDMTMHILDCNV